MPTKGSLLLQKEAEAIAEKLNAEIRHGRNHSLALVRWNGRLVAQYGIRRGKHSGHDYIPGQLFISLRQALGLANVPSQKNNTTKF